MTKQSKWTKEWAGVYRSRCGIYEINKGASIDPNLWDLRLHGRCIGHYDTLKEAKRASGL